MGRSQWQRMDDRVKSRFGLLRAIALCSHHKYKYFALLLVLAIVQGFVDPHHLHVTVI